MGEQRLLVFVRNSNMKEQKMNSLKNQKQSKKKKKKKKKKTRGQKQKKTNEANDLKKVLGLNTDKEKSKMKFKII